MKYFKTIITLLLVAMHVHADDGTLYTSNRLSSALIECISQDKYGYIWVGTEYGLNKFDGYRFTTYYNNSNDSTSVTDNEIVEIVCDREGRLWVGCSSGLCRYDYERNIFVRYHFPEKRTPRVNSICQCGNGDILIGTAGYGLYSVRNGEDKITEEAGLYQNNNDRYYSRLFVDDHNMIWRSNHLNVFSRISIRNHKLVNAKNFVSPVGPPIDFLPTGDGNLLIVCMYGILRYDYGTERVTDAGYDLSAIIQRHSIRKAIIDNKRNIYLGTSGQGLMRIAPETNQLLMVDNNNGTFNLAASDIEDMMEDKDGNLWLACYQKGLFLLRPGNDAFNTWSFSNQNYSIGTSVSSITLDENGDVLCTVQNTGVYRFDHNGKIIGRLVSPLGSKAIHRDFKGQFWICTNNTLYRYYPSTGNSQPVLNSEGWGMNCIVSDKLGNIFTCNYGKGLIIYNTETHEETRYSMNMEDKKNGRLCNDWIRCMFADRYGIVWIGTANGLCCFNPQTKSFKHYGWEVVLENQQCMAIGESREGDIVIGTNAGLFLFDRISNKIAPFPDSDHLKNKLIYGIVTDREGDLWLSTSLGIWHYQHKNSQWLAHINGNGLTTKEYVLGATVQTSDGMIGFGTNDGITTFYPNDVRTSKIEMGEVFLTNFLVGGRSENCMKDEFTVAHDENSFTMEFSLLTYNNNENISFEYRINDSKEWLSTSEGSNAVTFNKMQPGKYKIEVRATCNGTVSKGTKVIYVTVKNPWYASPLAYLLYLLLFFAIVFLGLSYYVRQRKAEMEESKMRFLINATHDIRSPLTLIMGPLNKLKQRMNDEESLQDIETIDRNAQRLLLLVNQILDERKIDKHQMHLHCQKTDMVSFINGIFMLYQYNAQQRNIQYSFLHPDEKMTAWIDRINFDKVISNLLSNAFKYTFDGGEVVVRINMNKAADDKGNDEIVIQVTDNGIGLNETNTDRLFERFYQGSNSRDVHLDGTGIGLNLSKAIVEMHGGSISAANRDDGMRGTTLTVKLPTGNEHLKPEEIMTEEESQQSQAGTRKQASKNFRILIADDDVEIASYIRNELGNWYRFDAAPNGKEALKALLTGNYDLLISDIMMPEMDGITLLKKIKSNPNISDIPVILLTSKSEVSDRLEGFKKGADAFLAKPFNMEELHILIDNLVDNVRRLRGKFSGAQQQEEKMEKVEVKGNNDVLMERIMKCINENLQDADFNVEKLTGKVGISRAQLHRKMKEITGISAGDFIRNLRLEQAARLIKEKKINVTQVAYAVGFNNQAHFSTVFKKHYGMTPTEYSEQSLSEEEQEEADAMS